MTESSHPKIAIVADWLTNYGGAESVVSAFHDLFPEAPIYTTLYKPKAMRELGNLKNIHTSWLQKIPFMKHQWLLAQMPLAVEQFDLDEFDVVLSSCHSVAKGVITKPETLHLCYCHTPMRYAWESWDFESRLKKFPRILHPLIRHQIKTIREWDYCAAQRVDEYLAYSTYTQNQIRKYYKRFSEVIYPPINTKAFKPIANPKRDYYLAVGRLVPYKKFDMIVETFNALKKPLKIVGIGPDYKKLRAMAGPTVELLGEVRSEQLADLYANCNAVVFPQIEDAGIVPLESMASGRPVIAFEQGGSLDNVKEGVTGTFFKEQTIKDLTEAIQKFEKMTFDPITIRKHAEQFDTEKFKAKILEAVNDKWNNFKSSNL